MYVKMILNIVIRLTQTTTHTGMNDFIIINNELNNNI